MKILISKLLIIETLFRQIYMISNTNEDKFNLELADEGMGYTNTCSIFGLTDNAYFHELFLFCYEYEIGFDYDFHLNLSENREIKFILKSFYISRIIQRNNKKTTLTEPVSDNCLVSNESVIGVNHKFTDRILKNFNLTEQNFKARIKECDTEFINLGNLMREEEILYLPSEKFDYDDDAVLSEIFYPLGKNKKLQENSKDLLNLHISIFSVYFSNENKYSSKLWFFFNLKEEEVAEKEIINRHIEKLQLKDKLLEKSKMQNIEEGEELNFRFPNEEEKKEIMEKMEGLFDGSVLSYSIKTEEKMRNKKLEKEKDISVTKKEDENDGTKEESVNEGGNFILYLVIFVISSLVASVIVMSFKFIVFGNRSVKL